MKLSDVTTAERQRVTDKMERGLAVLTTLLSAPNKRFVAGESPDSAENDLAALADGDLEALVYALRLLTTTVPMLALTATMELATRSLDAITDPKTSNGGTT